jgi:hypothetical protein
LIGNAPHHHVRVWDGARRARRERDVGGVEGGDVRADARPDGRERLEPREDVSVDVDLHLGGLGDQRGVGVCAGDEVDDADEEEESTVVAPHGGTVSTRCSYKTIIVKIV